MPQVIASRGGNMEQESVDDPFYERLHTFLQASNSETDTGQWQAVTELILCRCMLISRHN